jgi:hypothetical protein
MATDLRWLSEPHTPSLFQYTYIYINGSTAPIGPGRPHYQRFMITLRHTTRYESSERVIDRPQRPLPDNI